MCGAGTCLLRRDDFMRNRNTNAGHNPAIQLKPLEEQVMVVFGASSGIGRGTALAFAKQGAKVVVAARNEKALAMLAQEIREEGGEVLAIPADTGDYEAVNRVAEQAFKYYGQLDTWVHTAAVSLYATFQDTTPQEFRQVIETNLLGQAYGAMAALPYLEKSGQGALIHISSVEGQIAFPYQSAYAASKHGMIGFLDALRLELTHDHVPVSVTTIMPSGINTPFFEKARTKLGVRPKPIDPVYQPETVVNAILYAAEHPVATIVVGDAGKLLVWMKRWFPGLVHWFVLNTGFSGQRTGDPKSEDAPDNLYAPLPNHTDVHGEFGMRALPVSLSNWMERHPIVQKAVAGGIAFWLIRQWRTRNTA